jgi:hypothetical protein
VAPEVADHLKAISEFPEVAVSPVGAFEATGLALTWEELALSPAESTAETT